MCSGEWAVVLETLCFDVAKHIYQASSKGDSLKFWAAGIARFPILGATTRRELVDLALDNVLDVVKEFEVLGRKRNDFNKQWDPIRNCCYEYLSQAIRYACVFIRFLYPSPLGQDSYFNEMTIQIDPDSIDHFIFDTPDQYADPRHYTDPDHYMESQNKQDDRTLGGIIPPYDQKIPPNYFPLVPSVPRVIPRRGPYGPAVIPVPLDTRQKHDNMMKRQRMGS